jgi:hypothetical protein
LRSASDVGFNRAVKHLFRHLHEPHALRRNRLVQHFFEATRSSGSQKTYERAALERIHELVRLGAAYCRDADLAAGKEERALRQHAIVTQQCLEQRPIREVAARLGISYYHCYRERAEICRRVARYICERDDAPSLESVPEFDEFQLRLDRAMHRATCNDAAIAFAESDELVRVAGSVQQRIEALRIGALIAMRFGEISRAESAYRCAQTLFDDPSAFDRSSSQEVARACIDLIAAKLAYHHANPCEALSMAEGAMSRLQPIQTHVPTRIAQLYAESLFELGAAFWNSGNFEKGYQYVVDAEAALSHIRSASPRLRMRLIVEIWQLRNYLLMSSKSWYPAWQRVQGLTTAFEQAYAAGAFFEATNALVALTEHHAFAGNDDEALRIARNAVLLAGNEPSERLRAHIAIQLAMMLLWTRHWSAAMSFLSGSPAARDAYDRKLASYFVVERAFRLRAFHDAWKLARDERGMEEYAALTLRRKLIAAAAAHELQRKREAGSLIEAMIPAAKKLGSVPILRDTYSVAAKVTGDSRFKREATELARLLTA